MKLKTMTRVIFALLFLFAMLAAFAPGQASASSLEDGISLYYQRNWAQAAKQFEAALSENPNDSLALSFLLRCYTENNDLSAISNKFEQAAINNPGDAYAIANLGFAYFTRSMFNPTLESEAVEQFKKALKVNQNLSLAYTGMGYVYFQKRMMPRAKGYFLKALQINPNDIIASELLGNILLVDEKRYDEALLYFKKIADMVPNYADARYFMGSTLYETGNYPDALKELDACAKIDPYGLDQGREAPQLMGLIYMKQKMYKQAAACFENALKIDPQNSYAKYMLEKALNPEKESKPKNK